MWHNCSQCLNSPLGFGAEQRVNYCIAINPETPMRHTDPRAAYVSPPRAQARAGLRRISSDRAAAGRGGRSDDSLNEIHAQQPLFDALDA